MRENGRVFLVPEVEWDDAERAWIEALRWYREDYLCPCGCGWPRAVSLASTTEMSLTVGPPVVCQVTKRIALAQREWLRDESAYSGPGLMWSARLRAPGDAGEPAQ